ncbi:nucleoside hydrolase [Granulosicoccus antarcticus]|uniref:Pyrimidine-specific ribonucleoside hydrolase RihA n=1 Tax=Granulosicoccus antarcticus IMCC3135 TaxID=1192854 RepID=A0A2Z2NT85_9GAMM|nr:nucleoside hydrolase [Granulosicoccus antarcticus]ASJ71960.1 Pyrimidine-specific ribonucleoside hydrolase RihA [Granulosicoccus antarcticus IMCC3135]
MADKCEIIIDTDPGQDDAIAILLALASPELDVLGITAVAGNVPLTLTTSNICKVCELASRSNTKVYVGSDRPIKRELFTAEYVHGATGLNGTQLPEPSMALQEQHAVDFIIETILSRPNKSVTLCTLGPLTNIGKALSKAPEIAPRIKELVMMGGGLFEGGNVTPVAEFNIYVDPEAAKLTFDAGIPIVVMPLDVTHKTLTTKSRIDAFRALGTKVGTASAEWLDFFERFDEEKYGTDGGPLHDPNVIAYLLKPELYSGRHINVEIETESALTVGMTVADYWRVTDRPRNAIWMTEVDSDGFFDLILERLAVFA